MDRRIVITVTEREAGLSYGDILRGRGFSRHLLAQMKKMTDGCRDGACSQGKRPAPGTLFSAGDSFPVYVPETECSGHIVPTPMTLAIVYEDEDILVVNKPAGLPVHPSTGNYAKHIQHPKSEMDWLSRDMACVEEYLRDPRCGYRFTARGYHDLFVLLRECNRKGWAQAIRRDLPVYLFSGDEDPVGNYGKGVLAVRDAMRESGMHDVRCKLYRGGRHEMLNEINKAEVYEDIWEFLKDTVLQEEEEECSPV